MHSTQVNALFLASRAAHEAASPNQSTLKRLIMFKTATWGIVLLSTCLSPAFAQEGTKNTSGVEVPAAPDFTTDDPRAYGLQIASYADIYDRGWTDEVSQGVMTLFGADGDSVRRTFTRMVYERPADGDKLLIKFMSPADIRGVTALTHEHPGSSDDNWLYLPANKRVRRISGANNTASFQGTEFTYEDLSNIDPSEYEWRFVQETDLARGDTQIPVYQLDANPTYKDTGYSRIVVYYNRDNFRQERIEYFDKAGIKLKVRDGSDWHQLHGRFWRAHDIEMKNMQTGKRTTLVQEKEYLNLSLYKSSKTGEPRENLTEERFTTRAIEK
ncbi:MAG: hypothetical protein ACI835_002018 [Planctomycetota bacterium]|jgi:hypothetical protein